MEGIEAIETEDRFGSVEGRGEPASPKNLRATWDESTIAEVDGDGMDSRVVDHTESNGTGSQTRT